MIEIRERVSNNITTKTTSTASVLVSVSATRMTDKIGKEDNKER